MDIKKHQITGNVAQCIGPIGGARDFWRTKICVHSDCNEKFGKNLEEKLASGRFNINELWLWVMIRPFPVIKGLGAKPNLAATSLTE